jgi:succinate dehydrogenase/fumarate reductase flavoprotein subunit
MTTWHEYLESGLPAPEWPYPVRYGSEIEVETDVLVLGGGIAGCHAAINAKRKGARVVLVEKGATKWSGHGGAGVDHWLNACTNPCSRITPEEFIESVSRDCDSYDCGPSLYINAQEAWETLLDIESMGVMVRDMNDEFKGAAFRDDETKLMFAYDYKNRIDIRVHGHNVKPCLYRELKRLGVQVYDRVMITGLLTEGGRPGARVAGATGVNTRTGEFYVFRGKASIVAMQAPGRLWTFSTEHRSMWNDLNNAGEGFAITWDAGAEFVNLEKSWPAMITPFSYIPYGVGNTSNTWHGTPIVDTNGKEVPWLDRDGNEVRTAEERFEPSPGQKFILGPGQHVPHTYENDPKVLAPDLSERIRKGEFVLPLYADLTRLPEKERRAIFGLMVGNEGKTRIPVYDILTKAGFDPDKDMLQVPVLPVDAYNKTSGVNYWAGKAMPLLRAGAGGLLVDWDLRTNLEGLYGAGGTVSAAGAHSTAATGGRYAGRKAAAYALTAAEPIIDAEQVRKEKARVYGPLQQKKRSIGWKELNAGICRIMQDYCGQYKNQETLAAGLRLLRELREAECSRVYAATPHDLGRALECHTMITVGEMVIQACMVRKASNKFLSFSRIDYPAMDPPEWQKYLPIRLEDGEAQVRELPLDYHLRPPYAAGYEENYRIHCEL